MHVRCCMQDSLDFCLSVSEGSRTSPHLGTPCISDVACRASQCPMLAADVRLYASMHAMLPAAWLNTSIKYLMGQRLLLRHRRPTPA